MDGFMRIHTSEITDVVIIGDNEVSANGVTVRSRKEGELGCLPLDEVFTKLITEVAEKAK